MTETGTDVEGHARRIGAWQVRAIILIVSIAFLLVAVDLTPGPERAMLYTGIIRDIGVVILSLIAVDLVWQLVGGDPIHNALRALRGKLEDSVAEAFRFPAFADHARRLGMDGVAGRQDSLPLRIAQRIDSSSSCVDISGWALDLIREDHGVHEALLRAVKRGVQVRLLLAHPNADWLKATNFPGKVGGVQAIARELLPELRQLSADGGTVRWVKDVVIMFSIIRFDDWMQVMPYFLSETSRNSPRFHLNGPDTSLFKSWMKEFEYAFDRGLTEPVTYAY